MTLEPFLRDFGRFLNGPGDLSVVAQLAVTHYQFETIHPFMDGNGRLGRLLITLMLCERQVLPLPLLYLSVYFEKHDNEYRDLMLDVSRRGAWVEWITFFAKGVGEQARDAVQRLLDLWRGYRQRVQDAGQPAFVLTLVDRLFAAPAITITGAAKLMNVSFPTAQKYVESLESVGVLTEATGKARKRTYLAREILRLLDEPVATDEPTAET